MSARVTDEGAKIIDAERRADDQHLRRAGEKRDRREVLVWVVRQRLVEMLVRRDRAIDADEQRVAVGWRVGHGLRADVAAGAGAVLHDERLAKRCLQLRAEQAPDDIRRRARWERHDELDRVRGIWLRRRGHAE